MISRLVQVFRGSPLQLAAGAVAVPQPAGMIEGRAAKQGLAAAQGTGQSASKAALGNIQVLRGLAATAVLLSHVVSYTHEMRGTALPPLELCELGGQAGVAVFFAISGFLMAGLIARGDPWRFLAHRVVRIFPTYVAMVLLFYPIFALCRLGFAVNVFTLSLAPVGPRGYSLGIEWTLVFETVFYISLFALGWAGLVSRLVPLTIGWVGLLAVAWFVFPHSPVLTMQPAPYLLLLSPACVAFAGGLLLPHLVERGWLRPALAWLVLPLVVAAIPFEDDARRWVLGGAAVILVGAAVRSPQTTQTSRFGRASITFGDWSYVLYLVHVPLIFLVIRFAPAHWSGPWLWITMVAAALGATALLGPFDVLLYRRLRGVIDRIPPVGLQRTVAGYLAVFFALAAFASLDIVRNGWREADARVALAKLPAPAWVSSGSAEMTIAERALNLPPSARGVVDAFERISSKEFLLTAWAFDSGEPKRQMLLAAFCGARLIGFDRPNRLRPTVATQPGLESSRGKRIGYRLRIPDQACAPGEVPVAVVVGEDGRMAVLRTDGQPVEVSEAL